MGGGTYSAAVRLPHRPRRRVDGGFDGPTGCQISDKLYTLLQ